MARNNYVKSNKSKLLLILLLVGMLCLSLFGVACNQSATDDPPKYSYLEKDDGIISNPSFAYGTMDIAMSTYIKTSVTGWSKSKDTYSNNSSAVNSGVVSVSENGWQEVLSDLYSDSDFLKYLGVTKSDIENQLEQAGQPHEATDVKDYIIENYITPILPNPGCATDSEERIIYMMNNYATVNNSPVGLSQKITSSTEVTLEKGENAQIKVWVRTQNISDNGASIRLANSFNGNTQADVALINIDTQGAWKQYTLFVEGDSQFKTSFKLSLGLGYSLNYETQGTAYFDNVEVIKYTAEESADFKTAKGSNYETATLDYTSTTKKIYKDNVLGDNNLVVSLSLDTENYNFVQETTKNTNLVGTIKGEFSGNATDLNANVLTTNIAEDGKNSAKLDLKNASYSLNIESTDFLVATEEYAYVELFVKNQLNKFSSTSITFNVIDKYNSHTELRSAVATITEVSNEWQKVGLIIKNNFDSETYPNANRTFIIQLVVGPTDLSTAEYKNDFANGTVFISIPTITKGATSLLEDETNKNNYEMFKLYSTVASGSTALYAGLDSDFTDSSNSEIYNLTTNPSDVGKILTGPSTVSNFQGIVANHFYINEETENNEISKAINTRVGDGDADGNFAGLINTKYLSTYKTKLTDIEKALGFDSDDDDNYQPIMIYNNTPNSYGFIGQAKTINASAYAQISVTLRVYGNAIANVYLVDVSDTVKNVIEFNNPENNEVKKLSLNVTSDMMEDNGWVTLDFFVATGATSKNFRVEIWNGSRDGQADSQGYVFVKDVNVITSSAFVEPTKADYAFVETSNPLYNEYKNNGEEINNQIIYKRPLTDTEKQFNAEQTDSSNLVTYENNYIWAENATMIYAIYNTIDPVEVDPYTKNNDNENVSGGCTAETDPSTFWLSFSSIILIVALVVAIVMLFIKTVRRRRKANRSDAKSHYKVTSRVRPNKVTDKKEQEQVTVEDKVQLEEQTDAKESTDTDEVEVEQTEQTLDSYVYGEVEVFGEGEEDNN